MWLFWSVFCGSRFHFVSPLVDGDKRLGKPSWWEGLAVVEGIGFAQVGKVMLSSVQFSHLVVSDSLWSHELQHTRLPCLSPTPQVYSNSYPLSWWCHPIISSSVVPFSSYLQSFPASGSFQMSLFFASGGQNFSHLMEFQFQHQSFQWIFRTDFL